MRSDDWYTERGTAVMDTLEEERASTRAPRRRAAVRAEDVDDEPEMYAETRRGMRLRVRGGWIPRSKWGRITAGCVLAMVLVAVVGVVMMTRRFLLHDERFVIAASESIEIQGNRHLNRAQLLSIFGEDVEKNIFNVSLTERRAELERLPWVEHATVMRLLPNRLRVAIVERVPVAFVRDNGKIEMVDASGVLLDMSSDETTDTRYSFPVVTGIVAGDPMSTRTARMKIYADFMKQIDASGEKVSEKLSEVDLSNPEDVKALIPEGPTDVLVHFGDTDYLGRYRKFEEHLPEWRTQYPKLASVDMRYDRQVVLEMQSGAPTAAAGDVGAPTVDGASVDGVASGQTQVPKGEGPGAPGSVAPAVGVPAVKGSVAAGRTLAQTQVPKGKGPGAPSSVVPAAGVTAGSMKAPAKTVAAKAPVKKGPVKKASASARTKAMLARGRVLKAQQRTAGSAGKPAAKGSTTGNE